MKRDALPYLEQALSSYCHVKGLELRLYQDEGISAKDAYRPELPRLLSDVKSGRVSTELVTKLDRISRSWHCHVSAGADRALRGTGCPIHLPGGNINTSGVAEVVTHFARNAASPQELPVCLRKRVAHEVKKDQHELAIRRLAGDGWRDLLVARVVEQQAAGPWRINTPRAGPVAQFSKREAGLEDIV